MTVLVSTLGAGLIAGACLVASGWTKSESARPAVRIPWGPAHVRRRLASAAACGIAAAFLTRWPVAAPAVAALGWFACDLAGSKAAREEAIARTEAIAAWTEMLRDTMSAAHGLEEALTTTSTVAPLPIRPEITQLALRLERQPLNSALRLLSKDLSHPIGDLVVASLILASEGAVGDLGELLGNLATSARDEAAMRLRVDAARARLRTSVRVIAGCTAATAAGLVLLNRPYLKVYQGAAGQVVLAAVSGLWGISFWWLARMGEFIAPERFLTVAEIQGTAADSAGVRP